MNEKHVEINTDQGVLRGMAHLPRSAKVPLGTLVIFHGYFSSHRVGPARLYVEIARLLASHDFCVIRFDCLGVGNSDGKFCDVTLKSEVKDYMRICSFALEYSNTSSLTIIGHSMGANLSLYVASKFKKIKALLLLAPEVEKLGGIDKLFDSKQLRELETKGWTIRKELFINASFVNAIRSKNILALARDITFPCFVFQGNKDELYSVRGAKLLLSCLSNGNLILIEGADHNFLNPECRMVLFKNIKNVVLKLYEQK